MKLKQIPQDFIVDEIYDIKKFEEKKEEKDRTNSKFSKKNLESSFDVKVDSKESNNHKKIYNYFILTKTNYTTLRAIENVARIFNVSKKFVHFAGTKDKVGITSQIISIFGIKEENLSKNLDFFNENLNDLKLEFLNKYNGRICLGDNLGNKFKIIIRDLDEKEISNAKKNIEKINKNGVLNFYDEQRFGYANNTNIIGKYLLQNKVELAVKEILTSLPKNPKEEHLNFVNLINENWSEIKNCNLKIIEELIGICPLFLRDEKNILFHLKNAKNDFPGAIRRVHKKIRTLYINAYQSYIFNELIKNEKINAKYEKLELVHFEIDLNTEIGILINEFLKKDDLNLENFKLKSMPELKLSKVFRQIKIFPKNLEIIEERDDDLNENKFKIKISFELEPGNYATNVCKQLF